MHQEKVNLFPGHRMLCDFQVFRWSRCWLPNDTHQILKQQTQYLYLLYPHQCYHSWYCWFHRVWSDAPDHHTVVFWIHITPLWNWWRSTQRVFQYTMHEALWRHLYRTVQNLYFICFQMKPTNSTPIHKHIFLIH